MIKQPSRLCNAIRYYVIAVALCAGIAYRAPLFGQKTLHIVMFTPLIAVLLMLLVVTRDGYKLNGWKALGLHRAGMSGWGIALLLPPLVLGFAYSCVWLSGVGIFAAPPSVTDAPAFFLDLIVSIVIVTLFGALGEEIGWRGYLLPHLLELGALRAALISGLLHGLWHLPVMIWTPFYHGAGNRWIVILLFLATLTLAGICYGYLRLTTASIWPAALAHSAFNIFWERFNAFTATGAPLALEYLAGESGMLTLVALALPSAWFAHRLKQIYHDAENSHPANGSN